MHQAAGRGRRGRQRAGGGDQDPDGVLGCCFDSAIRSWPRPFAQRRPTRRGGLNSPACRT
ncbi:hypothetical protein P4132_01315 [Pseudomonas aeruginosa]|nr:hypothetical protein [Pseudomonas aeruginosa]